MKSWRSRLSLLVLAGVIAGCGGETTQRSGEQVVPEEGPAASDKMKGMVGAPSTKVQNASPSGK